MLRIFKYFKNSSGVIRVNAITLSVFNEPLKLRNYLFYRFLFVITNNRQLIIRFDVVNGQNKSLVAMVDNEIVRAMTLDRFAEKVFWITDKRLASYFVQINSLNNSLNNFPADR